MVRKKREEKPYRLIGAYDSETTNYITKDGKTAFPILHQLGLFTCDIADINAQTVEELVHIDLYRHALDFYARLDAIIDSNLPYVPVIACHNLAFDMYGLSAYLSQKNTKVLAKSCRKPISFTIRDDENKPVLVIWDSLLFTQKPLAQMGDECGYSKLSGDWDYDLIRTPETPLTDKEKAYAKHDVYALICYLAYWLQLNPDIPLAMLGKRVVTKTGVVRYRRFERFNRLKGTHLSKTVGQYWTMNNITNAFKSDDELFTCNASTRGGLTFCASKNASVVFDYSDDDSMRVYGYDATSQHPAQIVSHFYPTNFHKASLRTLQNVFDTIAAITPEYVLSHFAKPFPTAVYAAYEFTDLKVKTGSLFDRYGIPVFASARCKDYVFSELLEENQDREEFKARIADMGYKDIAEDATYEFGKLVSAKRCVLYLTELAIWELTQVYEYSSVKPVAGYVTMRYSRPCDMAVISVMQFYDAKNEFKKARAAYYGNTPIENADRLRELAIPEFVISGMISGDIDEQVIESTYLGLKADLNALFGIEASNEYRRDTVIDAAGITYTGEFGIVNAPKVPKAWYQMGQRIVGWSRIAQILIMQLIDPYAQTIVNGDTDSIKFICNSTEIETIEKNLQRYAQAIDKAKNNVCKRVRDNYPAYYSTLDYIGYYVREFAVSQYCASWNKAYCMIETNKRTGDKEIKFTLAGIPAKRGVNQLATRLYNEGWTFAKICNLFLGYNVTYSHDLIKLNARKFPEWANVVFQNVTDHTGKICKVTEPEAICLYPMAKTLNDTANRENRENMRIAQHNNESVNTESVIIAADGFYRLGDLIVT